MKLQVYKSIVPKEIMIELFGTPSYIIGSFLLGWCYANLFYSDNIKPYTLLLRALGILRDSVISILITYSIARFFNIFDLYVVYSIEFILFLVFDLFKITISCLKVCLNRMDNQFPYHVYSDFNVPLKCIGNRLDGTFETDFSTNFKFKYQFRDYNVTIDLSKFEKFCYVIKKLLEYFKDRLIINVIASIFFLGNIIYNKNPKIADKLLYFINIILSLFIDGIWENQAWLRKIIKQYFWSRWWACFIAWLLGFIMRFIKKHQHNWFHFLWYVYIRRHLTYGFYILLIVLRNMNMNKDLFPLFINQLVPEIPVNENKLLLGPVKNKQFLPSQLESSQYLLESGTIDLYIMEYNYTVDLIIYEEIIKLRS